MEGEQTEEITVLAVNFLDQKMQSLKTDQETYCN